ncbi:hypothetical protein C482_17053 [Natrialba chahannaoensis JCM 10990]|uniref:SHOCT domain-containing protein n=1 Tax=Natrialba chahannaoensis JCM 10990 TaxID=1227492 RepID=M0A8V9_9EURY|nr:hypothetical protein [Natrialba chahannaoensis]ELY94806.1 hypothetical protein C482_17053 [Natrialba chahannaoensis JCM 10990]
MDNGTAAALLALVLGFPLVVVAAFTAGIPSSLAVFGLPDSLALAFVVAGEFADDNTQPAAASTVADTLDTTASEATDASSDTELESLREQYARGGLTERELDRELERVFDADSSEAAGSSVSNSADSGESDRQSTTPQSRHNDDAVRELDQN